jgi:hypothetical protein
LQIAEDVEKRIVDELELRGLSQTTSFFLGLEETLQAGRGINIELRSV